MEHAIGGGIWGGIEDGIGCAIGIGSMIGCMMGLETWMVSAIAHGRTSVLLACWRGLQRDQPVVHPPGTAPPWTASS